MIDLNRRIVARQRFLRQLETHVTMLEFRTGERVRPSRGHTHYSGRIWAMRSSLRAPRAGIHASKRAESQIDE